MPIMDMGTAVVIGSAISAVFGLLALELMSHNWFKKERFRFETFNLKKQNDLQLKKMARDMGLDSKSASSKTSHSAGDNVGGLLELAKGLNPDQLGAIADIIQGRLGGGEGEGELMPEGLDGLIEFATKNPDIVKGFLNGANKGKNNEDGFM